MNQSGLRAIHQSLGAAFGEEGGWEVPMRYGDLNAEHRRVRAGVGVMDLSHRGKLRISGNGRTTYLQGLVTNDITKLADGVGLYCAILTSKGKMQSYFKIFGVEDTFLIDIESGATEHTSQLLKRYLLFGVQAKLDVVTEALGHLALHGPSSRALLARLLDQSPPDVSPPNCARIPLHNTTMIIAKSDDLGEEGYDLFVPTDAVTSVWGRLWEAATGAGIEPFGAVGMEAFDTLRIEAGTPRLGHDLDETVFPAEAWLEHKAVSSTKGCYMGQETVARIDTYGQVNRRLAGLVINGDSLPARGTDVMGEDQDHRAAGRISSSAYSPTLHRAIALAYLRKRYLTPETKLTVQVNGESRDATVVGLPFIQRTQ